MKITFAPSCFFLASHYRDGIHNRLGGNIETILCVDVKRSIPSILVTVVSLNFKRHSIGPSEAFNEKNISYYMFSNFSQKVFPLPKFPYTKYTHKHLPLLNGGKVHDFSS